MTVKSPSYVTKSHHGVYYFQIRVDNILKVRLGLKSPIYRKSLKTKDKKVALRLARRLWVELYADDDEWNHMSKIPKVGTKEYDLWEAKWQDAERAKSKAIRIALNVDERMSKIPKWDFDAREVFYEALDADEHAAIQYISENNIILDEFREESERVEHQPNQAKRRTRKSKSLSELLEEYLADVRSNKGTERTINLYADQIGMFIELVTDLKSEELSYDDVSFYKSSLSKIPKNRNKKRAFKNHSIRELVKMNIESKDLLADNTLNTYSTNVKAFLEWATKRKYVVGDVATALDGVFSKAKSYPYLPFTDDDLVKIFLSSDYMSGKHKVASRYWIPLIALFTGARANEICQLSVSDVKSETLRDGQTHFFDFNDETYKSLKNDSSIRIVPIHSELIKLGFLEFVEGVKRSKSKRLFKDLKEYRGKYNHSFSKWFTRYLKSSGVESIQPDRRKAFHSFRHTFLSRLRANKQGIPIEDIEELSGHARKGTVLNVYASDLGLEKKAATIEKLRYSLKLNQIRRWKG